MLIPKKLVKLVLFYHRYTLQLHTLQTILLCGYVCDHFRPWCNMKSKLFVKVNLFIMEALAQAQVYDIQALKFVDIWYTGPFL